MTSRARRVQLLADRAGKRWSRRVAARLASRYGTPENDRRRALEEEAEALFGRLRDLDGPDPFATMIAAESAIEPRNPDDPDDD